MPFALAVCAAGGLGGCNLDWEKPDLSITPPPRFREAKPNSAAPIASGRDFAAKFGSQELTGLIEQAINQSPDIAAAVARINAADAQARIASAALWPSLDMNNIALRKRCPGTNLDCPSLIPASSALNSSSRLKPRVYSLFQLGLTAGYEIDFWGKNQDASNAARLLADSSRFDRDLIEISILASVMNAYFQVLTAQDRLRITRENVKKAETVYATLQARLKAGTANVLDTAQQGQVLAEVRATIPPLEQTLKQTKNQLAALVGRIPENIDVKGKTLKALRFPSIEPGLPSEVLLRRPDVAEAEARLASQEFSVLQARAEFFPSIKLTGQYGVQSALLETLLRPEAVAWQIAGGLTQPFFDGYKLQGNYMLQQGAYAELTALYRKQILTALSDTENALIAVAETARQLKLEAAAVAEGQRAFEAATAQLSGGLIDVVTVATTETALFRDEDLLEQVRLAHFQAATSLYQALGGGWGPTTREIEVAQANEAYEAAKGPWP